MLRDNRRCDGLIGDYCDGHFITDNAYFQEIPNALQLVMYYDEVETCDVLASHRGVHKLGTMCIFMCSLCASVPMACTCRCVLLYHC